VVVFSEHCNEARDSMKSGGFLKQLSECELVKDSVAC